MARPAKPTVKPYVARDGKVTHQVRIRLNGRQTTETFDNEAAAKVFALRVVAIGTQRAVAERERLDRNSDIYIPTLAEMFEQHLAELTGVQQDTLDGYRSLARNHWLPMLGDFRVDEIEKADIARWVNHADGKVSPKTIANAHSLLSAALGAAYDAEHIERNPAKGTRLPRSGEEDTEEIRFLTEAEYELLLAQFSDFWRPFIVTLFGTGLRFGEATAQRPGDWTLNRVITPRLRVVRSWKKGNKIGPPKSRASRRTVTLGTVVVDVVSPLIEGKPSDAWLFTTTTGKRITHANFYNRVWKPACLKASVCEKHRVDRCRCFSAKPYLCMIHPGAELPSPCGCTGTLSGNRPRIHDARHSHASWLIARGVRLEVVQERLGHESILTTREVYGHLMPDAIDEAARAADLALMPKVLEPSAQPRAMMGPSR